MSEKILFVDDEANVLSAIKRQMRKKFDVHTALGGQAGLDIVEEDGPFAVIVSDMRMPEMDGIRFLQEVVERDPDTVCIMLTGNADQATAVNAINDGNIFSFLNKPCPPDTLEQAVITALKQYRLIVSERTLLKKTLAGSIKMLVDLLGILDPDIFGRKSDLRERIRIMAKALNLGRSWQLDMAAMLCNIGHVSLPAEVLKKIKKEQALSPAEQEMLERVPLVARDLISNIPRLEEVCEIIYYQGKRYDGGGFPKDDIAGEEIPQGSRLLKLLSDLEAVEGKLGSTENALDFMAGDEGAYDPALLAQARSSFGRGNCKKKGELTIFEVNVKQLQPGDTLASDVMTGQCCLVLAAGCNLSQMDIERLRNKQAIVQIQEPIRILRESATAEEGREVQ